MNFARGKSGMASLSVRFESRVELETWRVAVVLTRDSSEKVRAEVLPQTFHACEWREGKLHARVHPRHMGAGLLV